MVNEDCGMTPRPPQDIEDKGSSTVTLSQYSKLVTVCYLSSKLAVVQVVCGQNCHISLLLSFRNI